MKLAIVLVFATIIVGTMAQTACTTDADCTGCQADQVGTCHGDTCHCHHAHECHHASECHCPHGSSATCDANHCHCH
ncbi:hypothetical protein ACJMK2_036167 [Sinanodonta woodiana]|uniref:Uncharacterized protein n=1 Tax=Sinanodonta woodiana TaxID=1069815 RepID=A0ABD3WGD3_SINWO